MLWASCTVATVCVTSTPWPSTCTAWRFQVRTVTLPLSWTMRTIVDDATSIGIVQLYFGELQERLAAGAPDARTPPAGVLADSFEQDLNRNLTLLFRR